MHWTSDRAALEIKASLFRGCTVIYFICFGNSEFSRVSSLRSLTSGHPVLEEEPGSNIFIATACDHCPLWCIPFIYGSWSHAGTSRWLLINEAAVTLHTKPSTSFWLHPLKAPKRCSELQLLVYQRCAERCGSITAHDDETARRKTARRAGRQPISGLVSLQHLAGTEATERTWAEAAGRKNTSRLRDAQLWFCELYKEGGGLRHQVIKTGFIY